MKVCFINVEKCSHWFSCFPCVVVALGIQLGAPVEPGNFPNDQEIHLLLGLGANVGVVSKVVLALESTIEVLPVVAVTKKEELAMSKGTMCSV